MGTLIGLIIFVLILMVALFAVDLIVANMGLPPRMVQIVKLLIGLLAILWLVQQFAHPWGGFYFQ